LHRLREIEVKFPSGKQFTPQEKPDGAIAEKSSPCCD
jgi:hypothetical protein